MKHNEIIEINEYFQDCCDLMNEGKGYWKRFIITNKFEKIMYVVMNALSSPKEADNKSIWIQGNYGTGKTHSTSVVKHLLWDDYDEIENYITQFSDIQLREKIKTFRERNKVLPVILKGVSNIKDTRDLNFVLQSAIKQALKNQGIEIETKSDYEIMIEKLKDIYINWDIIIQDNQEIKMIANNTEDLIKQLQAGNSNVLQSLKEVLNEKNHYFSYINISDWLLEVLKKLKRMGITNYIMIYWDEFTSVMQLSEKKAILTEIQNISDLSKKGIYFYLVSHKKLEALEAYRDLEQEEKQKVKNRFYVEEYNMQTITTYHIISGALNKVDKGKWRELKHKYIEENPEIIELINRLSDNYDQAVRTKIKEMYPIHPYTAFLATFTSKYIGSTERSIFKFLNNDKVGFVNFLENDVEAEPFLNAEGLWDFFIEDVRDDTSGLFTPILDKYNLYIDKLKEMPPIYAATFKVILLLNTLYKITMTNSVADEASMVIPHVDNIRNIFVGTKYEDGIDKVLDYFDKGEIIHRSPEGIFELAFSRLPIKEVENTKRILAKRYENPMKIFDEFPNLILPLETHIIGTILRKTEINFFWIGDSIGNLRRKIANDYKYPYTLQIAVFLIRGQIEDYELLGERGRSDGIKLLDELSKEPENKNKIFVLTDTPLTESVYLRFINHMANSTVAKNLNIDNEAQTHQNKAEGYIEQWIESLKNETVNVFFNGSKTSNLSNIVNIYINNKLSREIFKYGMENVAPIFKQPTIWEEKKRTTAIEHFVFADTRQYIEDKLTGQQSQLKGILKNNSEDYIVNENLEINELANIDHPTIVILKKVQETIGGMKGRSYFNLGEELQFLTGPPYGVYNNYIYMSLMGFVLRGYIGNLYESGTGKAIEKGLMRDKVDSLFKYWKSGREKETLDVRYGTEEEKKLIDMLIDIFQLKEVDGLTDVRWAIRNQYTNKEKYPMWSLKYISNVTGPTVNKTIDKILKFSVIDEREIDNNKIQQILNSIESCLIDLRILVQTKSPEVGFKNFLKQIQGCNIKEDEMEEVVKHLSKNMQEEISLWEEEKVKTVVLQWRLAKQNKQNNIENYQYRDGSNSDDLNQGEEFGEAISYGKIRAIAVIGRIKNYRGDIEDIKRILVEIIEINPGLCKYFEESF